jgi:hypothetical protein
MSRHASYTVHSPVSLIPTETEDATSKRPEGTTAASLDAESQALLAKLDEASPLSDQLHAFSKGLGLRDRELMRLADVSRPTLARWRKEARAERPPGLDDLRAIADMLIRKGGLMPTSVAGWLRSRNRGLDWERPLDVLREGQFPLVRRAAEAACGGRVPVEKLPEGR